MNKRERLEEITRLVNKKGTVRISEIVELLNVTDMTVRRDFIELEEQGVLTKFMAVLEVIRLFNIENIPILRNTFRIRKPSKR